MWWIKVIILKLGWEKLTCWASRIISKAAKISRKKDQIQKSVYGNSYLWLVFKYEFLSYHRARFYFYMLFWGGKSCKGKKKSELSCQKNGVEISYEISIFFSLAKKKMIINAEHDTVETHLQSDHPEFELFFWVHYLSMRHMGTLESDAKKKFFAKIKI